ncbi:hypothetical protein NQ317_013774 [Molorchus minor]|uniref:beta-ketoacyl-[acyl-carrier-protein] synthase I n=1 Tax=Molorchus minor TaxID=1323400 RepID=A0ABQ9IX93_9CUCU|nr:hypothetical protein NQ317_013774 [Molorchus minor]
MQRRVVVTGMGVLSPVGTSTKEAWKNIIDGKCGISKIEGRDYENLPCKIAGFIKDNGAKFELSKYFSKTELKTMAPATGYALLTTKQALEDADLLSMSDEVKQNTGVAVGMGMVDLDDICGTYESLKERLSSFSTACATGAHAIGDSFRFIKNGDADVMVCGGTESCISPLSIAGFCRLRALSTSFNDEPEKASRPFDKRREGYGLSGDASHLTAPRADGTGAFLAMNRAVKDANININKVTYVNAHATSTPLGDTIEIRAIKSLFKSNYSDIAVSSTKGAHGHLLGAAGNLESVFTIKAIEEGILPPTINLETVEDKEINFVPIKSQQWNPKGLRIALKNAFGFGGD